MFLFLYRSKTYVFEEFLFTWQDRLRKLEQPTAMSVKLQGEVDKYKVDSSTVEGITCHCLLLSSSIFVRKDEGPQTGLRGYNVYYAQQCKVFGQYTDNSAVLRACKGVQMLNCCV